MPRPVRARNGRALAASPGTSAKSRLAPAAQAAPAQNTSGPGSTSVAPVAASTRAPTANPIWTATARNVSSSPLVCQSAASSGATAAALNQGENASSMPVPMTASARQRPGGSAGAAGGSTCKEPD